MKYADYHKGGSSCHQEEGLAYLFVSRNMEKYIGTTIMEHIIKKVCTRL